MKTLATVIETPEEGIAVIKVERQSACEGCHRATEEGGCSVCTLLGGKNAAHARARNTVGAAVGDRVELESRTGRILSYAALVFLLPVIALIAGYLLGGLGGDTTAGNGVKRSLRAIGKRAKIRFHHQYSFPVNKSV